MNLTLYEISNRHQEALSFMLDNDVDDQTMLDTLESIEGELAVKGQSVAAFCLNLDAQIEMMKQAENRMTSRRKSLEKKSNGIKQYLLDNMTRCGITKITAPEFEIGLAKCPPSVDILDVELLPDKYVQEVTEQKVLKDLIGKDLKSGIDVPGAKLITDKKRLTVK